jgi:hypothetical protein
VHVLGVGLGEDGADRGGDPSALPFGTRASTLRMKCTLQAARPRPASPPHQHCGYRFDAVRFWGTHGLVDATTEATAVAAGRHCRGRHHRHRALVGPWLLTLAPNQGLTADQELKAKNDVRTTLVQAVAGLAVASGALITYRTFLYNQKDQAKRHDREERTFRLHQSQQVTDTYTKAVEQLGSDQAPVRLGALYSLERLAQDDPSRRQTVVDVMCAYLRMPYTPPTSTKPATASVTASARDASPAHSIEESVDREAAQELQVRRTSQRLLAEHLRRPKRTLAEEDTQRLQPSPEESFWPGISLDLSGATFTEFYGDEISVARADFFGATFLGLAWFDKATFREGLFDRAKFLGAEFVENAGFSAVTFSDHASFHGVTFHRRASFHRATFHEGPTFGYTRIMNLDDPVIGRDAHPFRVWPDGWVVEPDRHDPTRGSLVPIKDEAAGPPSPLSETRA